MTERISLSPPPIKWVTAIWSFWTVSNSHYFNSCYGLNFFVCVVCLYVALALEEKCYEEMMTKFGRLVDLESLQTLSGNRKLEELRQLKLLQETAQNNKIKEWDVR